MHKICEIYFSPTLRIKAIYQLCQVYESLLLPQIFMRPREASHCKWLEVANKGRHCDKRAMCKRSGSGRTFWICLTLSKLIQRYCLDRAGITHVMYLRREVMSPITSHSRACMADLKVITGKMQQCNAELMNWKD